MIDSYKEQQLCLFRQPFLLFWIVICSIGWKFGVSSIVMVTILNKLLGVLVQEEVREVRLATTTKEERISLSSVMATLSESENK